MDITTAASTGDKRSTLIALRDYLAEALVATNSGRDQASLSKRLMEVMDAIEALPDPDEETEVDRIVNGDL